MARTAHTEQEEAAFMSDLLSGLDSSFFDAMPSPTKPKQVSPRKNTRHVDAHLEKPRKGMQSSDMVVPRTPVKQHKSKPRSPRVYQVDDAEMDVTGAFGDLDWEELSDYVPTPQKPKSKARSSWLHPHWAGDQRFVLETCTRCVVKRVEEARSNGKFEKHVMAELDPTGDPCLIILRDDWVQTPIRPGDTVNTIGHFVPRGPDMTLHIAITATTNLLIHHPDLLLTPTSLSAAPHCSRRPLLSSKSPPTPVLLYGNILHEVFQRCLENETWDAATIERWIDEAMENDGILGELVKCGIGVEEAKREVRKRAGGVEGFGGRYFGDIPKDTAVMVDTNAEHGEESRLAITGLNDVEEDIWAPEYGLKGKLDASVQAIISTKHAAKPTQKFPSRASSSSTASSTAVSTPRTLSSNSAYTRTTSITSFFELTSVPRPLPLPLELKTGRALPHAQTSHRAQTILYTLLMRARYAMPVDAGLLYYSQSEEVIRVRAGRKEVRALIGVRNEVAEWIAGRFRGLHRDRPKGKGRSHENGDPPQIEEAQWLPETIDDERVCGRCFVVDSCMLHRKAVENVEDTHSPIATLYAEKTGHLTPTQCAFFKDWERLVSLEEQDMIRFRKELWTLGAHEREARGRCFADMMLDGTFDAADWVKGGGQKSGKGIHQATYRFVRHSAPRKDGDGDGSLLNGHMGVGDPITVSAEPGLYALASGFILKLEPMSVVVGVGHVLDMSALRERVHGRRMAMGLGRVDEISDDVVFRVDRDELSGGMGRIRDNLSALFFVGGDSARLRLVVDLESPRFLEPSELAPLSPRCEELLAGLNGSQRKAVERVLVSEDYSLVLGMPGTGKTTLVAALILALVEMGKTVLLSAYTHSAVDTILSKLKGKDVGVLRIGNVDKVHPDVKEFTLSARRKARTVEDLERQLMTPPVVATTALSIDHELFSRRQFDYCIVDEASQITLPTCLGPLRFADKFVLVGDHYQLPPLVRSPHARKGGLDVSLFRRLSEAHPHAVVDLNEQYRMNEDIMALSNRLIYNNRLRCGSEEVARQSLKLSSTAFLDSLHSTEAATCGGKDECWLDKLMDENCKAVFVDTDAVPARDSRVGDLVQNEGEAALVQQVVETLVRSGVRETQIGVITPYRQQIKLLAQRLRARPGVEVLTADRSQGRDKDCIVISMVRSNEEGQVGDLVKDWRRMNVAFTRASRKMIVFGSRGTLRNTPMLEEFFQLMDERGWVLPLPKDAHLSHPALVVKDSRDSSTPLKRDREGIPNAPVKKMKVGDAGILRGRPILKDLVNDEM